MDVHPRIRGLNLFNMGQVIGDPEQALSLAEDIGLVPRRSDLPPSCPDCKADMVAVGCKAEMALGMQQPETAHRQKVCSWQTNMQ